MNTQALKFPQRPASPASRNLGTILVEAGRIDATPAERIAAAQKDSGLRFGEAGIRLGLLTEADVRMALARQFEYPYLKPKESSLTAEILAAYRPDHPLIECLRGLRSELLLRWLGTDPAGKSLAIVSAERREGRSFIAANLAVLFAQLGRRTLLIDADLRNPRQSRMFGIASNSGLSSILAERADIEAITLIPQLPNLSLLCAGPTPPNPQELLSRRRFIELVEQVRSLFDVILIDTPAFAGAADAQIVAARAGAALLVGQPHAAAIATAAGLVTALRETGTPLLGAVVNHR